MTRRTRRAQRDESAELQRAFGALWESEVDALRDALRAGDVGAAAAAFEGVSGAPPRLSVRGCDGHGLHATWLSFAAEEAPVAVARYMLSLGADVAERNIFGDTALHTAARYGSADVVALLLAEAPGVARLLADANLTGATPLHLAAMSGSVACVEALCAAGAPVNAQGHHEGETPAFFAVRSGAPALLRYLVSTGPRAHEVDFTVRSFPPRRTTLLELALSPLPIPQGAAVRQIVVEEACAREARARGSGDPDNLLGLYGSRGRGAAPGLLSSSPFAQLFGGLFRGGYIPDSDPAVAPPPPSAAHLPRRGRVLRYRDGASVAQPAEMAPSEFIAPALVRAHHPALLALLMATHPRLGADSPARTLPRDAARIIAAKLAKRPRRSCAARCGRRTRGRCPCAARGHKCFSDCAERCQQRTTPALSDCARDHISVVRSLGAAGMRATYPLACAEVWGGAETGHEHSHGSCGVAAPLRELLDTAEPCEECCGDGTQFFSFCLNRAVPADRVTHCLSCGQCFYFRPGFLRYCPYCEGNPFGPDAEDQNFEEGSSEAEQENETELRFAAEGYWGM